MLQGANKPTVVENPQTLIINIKPDDIEAISRLSEIVSAINSNSDCDSLEVFVDGNMSAPLLSALVAILPQLKISKFSLTVNSIEPQNLEQLIQIIPQIRWSAFSLSAPLTQTLSRQLYTRVSNNQMSVFHFDKASLLEEDFTCFIGFLSKRPNNNLRELSLHHAKLNVKSALRLVDPVTFSQLEVLDLSWAVFVEAEKGFALFCQKILISHLHTLSLTAPLGLGCTKLLCDTLVKIARPFTLKLTVHADVSPEELDAFTQALYLNPLLKVIITDVLDDIIDKDKLKNIALFNIENTAICQEQSNFVPTLLFQRYHSLLLAGFTNAQLSTFAILRAIPSHRAPTLSSLAAKKMMQEIKRFADPQLQSLPLDLLLKLPSKSITHHLSILKSKYDVSPLLASLATLNLNDKEQQAKAEAAVRNEVIRLDILSKLRSNN